IAADGGYVQHSFNYQRLMLDAYTWCLRLGELNGERLNGVTEKVASSSDLLMQIADASGHVPNYGSNDGALLLPLSDLDFNDHRQVLQASGYAARRQRSLPKGAWDEALLWLFGPEAFKERSEAHPRVSLHATES